MNRRNFLCSTLAVSASAAATAALGALETTGTSAASPASDGSGFRLLYAPHFGMFEKSAGKDPVEQLKFMADQGFRALEDNGMKGRTREEQDRIAKEMERLGMTMGVFVAHGDFSAQTFVHRTPEVRDRLRKDMQDSVELAKRVNAKWATVVPDLVDPKSERAYQDANVIDNLRDCCDICEPAGLTMVLEPLNPRDHPGMYLATVAEGYEVCRAVNRPSCKILADLYHQQIAAGNLIPNLDRAWSEIAYIQLGDNPGRNEPGTGEVNYKNVFAHLHKKGYKGVLGMEHGNSRNTVEGERATIAAYRACDSF
ncbi:MAG: hydroxypyruvate isomerase family protein [Candidatus Sumerlaeaceae bacterium]